MQECWSLGGRLKYFNEGELMIEIRLIENKIDEIVAKNATVHVEQLDEQVFHMSLEDSRNYYRFVFCIGTENLENSEGVKVVPVELKLTEEEIKENN